MCYRSTERQQLNLPHPGGYTEEEQMDTSEVADKLGTTPRVLRQFLRSDHSTYVAVGSGARYDFNDKDLPTLLKRFGEWQGAGKPKPEGAKKTKVPAKAKVTTQRIKDMEEWSQEGPVVIQDIRDPRVRARVKRAAQAAEAELMMLLLSKGLHITQLGDRESA
jgi:hypothetical protein